jgi:glycosyltransferase involved in cell wall biosynthesis
MIVANLSNLCWKTGQQRRNQAIFSHLLLDSDGFEEGFFIQPPQVKTARTFQFTRTPEIEVVLETSASGRPVKVLQPTLVLPSGFPASATRRAVAELGQKLVQEVFQGRPYLLWINSITHFQAQLAEQLLAGAAYRVFDSSDLLMMYQRNGGEPMKRMNGILNGCDAAVATNERTLANLAHPVKSVLSHYTEYNTFQNYDPDFEMAPLFPKPAGAVYLGFTGTLTAERIDFDLLHAVMTRFPSYQFIFVGTTNRPSLLARLKEYKNFHHIPEQSEQALASIIRQFNIAIVPELDNDYTRGCDGTKILDYLACGIPVLSTVSPSGDKFGESITVAPSVWSFCNLLERLVMEKGRFEPKFGMMVAQNNSWCNQVPQFVDWLFDKRKEQAREAQTVGGRLISTVKAYL